MDKESSFGYFSFNWAHGAQETVSKIKIWTYDVALLLSVIHVIRLKIKDMCGTTHSLECVFSNILRTTEWRCLTNCQEGTICACPKKASPPIGGDLNNGHIFEMWACHWYFHRHSISYWSMIYFWNKHNCNNKDTSGYNVWHCT